MSNFPDREGKQLKTREEGVLDVTEAIMHKIYFHDYPKANQVATALDSFSDGPITLEVNGADKPVNFSLQIGTDSKKWLHMKLSSRSVSLTGMRSVDLKGSIEFAGVAYSETDGQSDVREQKLKFRFYNEDADLFSFMEVARKGQQITAGLSFDLI